MPFAQKKQEGVGVRRGQNMWNSPVLKTREKILAHKVE
jgi:hypothetical protein